MTEPPHSREGDRQGSAPEAIVENPNDYNRPPHGAMADGGCGDGLMNSNGSVTARRTPHTLHHHDFDPAGAQPVYPPGFFLTIANR